MWLLFEFHSFVQQKMCLYYMLYEYFLNNITRFKYSHTPLNATRLALFHYSALVQALVTTLDTSQERPSPLTCI
jgi:hypothetical protein